MSNTRKGKVTVSRSLISGDVSFNPYNPGEVVFATSTNFDGSRYIGRDWTKKPLSLSITDPSHRPLTLRQILERQASGLSVDIDKNFVNVDVDVSALNNLNTLERLEYLRQLRGKVDTMSVELQKLKADEELEALNKRRQADIDDAVKKAMENHGKTEQTPAGN